MRLCGLALFRSFGPVVSIVWSGQRTSPPLRPRCSPQARGSRPRPFAKQRPAQVLTGQARPGIQARFRYSGKNQILADREARMLKAIELKQTDPTFPMPVAQPVTRPLCTPAGPTVVLPMTRDSGTIASLPAPARRSGLLSAMARLEHPRDVWPGV